MFVLVSCSTGWLELIKTHWKIDDMLLFLEDQPLWFNLKLLGKLFINRSTEVETRLNSLVNDFFDVTRLVEMQLKKLA